MKCPKCGTENDNSAKFCKRCGAELKQKSINHGNMISSMQKEQSSDTTKLIIAALIVIVVVLAGAFVYLYGFNNDNGGDDAVQVQPNSQDSVDNTTDDNNQPAQTTAASTSQPSSKTQASSPLTILGGSFSTGSGLSDKTYASIYVGPEHAGENVKVQIFYSRDGSSLNNGNMVPKTVSSDGYIEVASADSYKYFPDYADINIYDNSGNLLDSQSVSLSPSSGTQNF